MDWWLVPVGIAVVVLLWFLWEAAFHSRETVSAMPELEGYVPAESDLARSRSGDSMHDPLAVDQSSERSTTGRTLDSHSDEEVPSTEATESEVDDDGIWIEIDIEPLFASSESRQIVEVTEDPEVTP